MIEVTDEVLSDMVQTIVREVDPEGIYLFGSRARGEAARILMLICSSSSASPLGLNMIASRKSIGYTGHYRLFGFPTMFCSIRVMNLRGGLSR